MLVVATLLVLIPACMAVSCPPGSVHLAFSKFCVCEKPSHVCVDRDAGSRELAQSVRQGCGKTSIANGADMEGFDASCETCSCVDDSTMCELVLAEPILSEEKCKKSMLWPNCGNRLWGFVKKPLDTSPALDSCNGDISQDGRWVLPCNFPISNKVSVFSEDFPPAVRWQPWACSLMHMPTQKIAQCLQTRTLLFLGDSTMRGILTRLAALFGVASPGPGPRHNHWSTKLGNYTHAYFQYYPPVSDTKPVGLWSGRRADAGDKAAFVDYLASAVKTIQDSLGKEQWKATRLYISLGGLHLRADWIDSLVSVVHSTLWGGARAPVVFLKSQGQTALRPSLYDIHQKNIAFRSLLSNVTRIKFRWFETEAITQPFWPQAVAADKCLCHFQMEYPGGGAPTGPINTELMYVWLNGLCAHAPVGEKASNATSAL
jgi:hypothetical protein